MDANRRGSAHRWRWWWTGWLAVLIGAHCPAAAEPPPPAPLVMLLEVADPIGPGVADHVRRGLERAARERAACAVIRLDTPGGLVESMRQIVRDIFAAPVPVVVYVAPAGARAASAGVMITLAADVAAMAPGTNIGAAHPVGAGGRTVEGPLAEKITNDMVAHARSIAQRRGRNAAWAERAVRESVSVTAAEALAEGIIDVTADSLDDLLAALDGRRLEDRGITLDLAGARVAPFLPDLRTRVLKTVSNPNIAYILMMVGLAGLYFELSHPGAVFPGVVGGICLVLAFFAFQALPVNTVGVLLIGLALVLFVLEIKVTSYGMLSLAGTVCLFIGSLMLFDRSDPGLRISWRVVLPLVGGVAGFFVLVSALVVRAQVGRPRTGAEGLIGEPGVVRRDLAPEGKVLVHGETWRARSDRHLSAGTRVRVVRVESLMLWVAPDTDQGVQ